MGSIAPPINYEESYFFQLFRMSFCIVLAFQIGITTILKTISAKRDGERERETNCNCRRNS